MQSASRPGFHDQCVLYTDGFCHMSINHVNFELDILGNLPGNRLLILARSPIGRAQIVDSFLSELWEDFKPLSDYLWNRRTKYSTSKEYGSRLFDLLFQQNIRLIYYESLRFAKSQGKRLRIILDVQDAQFAGIPWELMYDDRNREYLCLSLNTQLVRYLECPHPFRVKDVKLPLRILGVSASPVDFEWIDAARERQAIEEAIEQHNLDSQKLELTWLEGASRQELQQAIQLGKWHIFHFVGHSAFDDEEDEGMIILKDNTGRGEVLTAIELSRLLADSQDLCLAIFTGCQSAIGKKDLHSGLASALVRRGVPSAIAMQSEITDNTAIAFAQSFYTSLARHLSIDDAVAEARKAVSLLERNSVDWATPMLMTHSPNADIWNINVQKSEERIEMNRPIRILFLAANPKGTDQLRLDEEVREIDEALLQKAEFRDKFELKQQWAVRVSDLQAHLLRFQPDIVHFSGHGSAESEIILEDNSGNSKAVSDRALSQLFSVLKDNIRCVVLNACYSASQAQAIAEHIDCVIGMSNAIGDMAAISFAKSFYQALGYGRTIDTAFKLGVSQIDLEGLNEQDTPQLLSLNSDPEKMVFVVNV